MKTEQTYVGRRRFLCGMVGGGAAALGSTVAGPLASYVGDFRSEPPPDFVTFEPGQWDVAPGQSRMLQYGPLPVLLLRHANPRRTLKVFLAICTHFDCIVGYDPQEKCILCACHDGRFDLNGQVIAAPPPAPLKEFHYAVRGEQLIIALEKQNLEKAI